MNPGAVGGEGGVDFKETQRKDLSDDGNVLHLDGHGGYMMIHL